MSGLFDQAVVDVALGVRHEQELLVVGGLFEGAMLLFDAGHVGIDAYVVGRMSGGEEFVVAHLVKVRLDLNDARSLYLIALCCLK